MRAAARRARALLRYTDPALTQLACAAITAAWGLFLILPITSWGHSIIYRPLLRIMPEGAWGALFLLTGAAHLAATLTEHARWRRRFSYIGVIQWSVITVLFFVGQPAATATVMYGAAALAHAWVFVRVGLLNNNGQHRRGPGGDDG